VTEKLDALHTKHIAGGMHFFSPNCPKFFAGRISSRTSLSFGQAKHGYLDPAFHELTNNPGTEDFVVWMSDKNESRINFPKGIQRVRLRFVVETLPPARQIAGTSPIEKGITQSLPDFSDHLHETLRDQSIQNHDR
jgi:hypothetical protein